MPTGGPDHPEPGEPSAAPQSRPRTYRTAATTWGGRLAWIGFAVFLLTVNFIWVWTCSNQASRRIQRKMKAEALQMILSIRAAEEAHRKETSHYLSTSDRDENDFYPAIISEPTTQSFTPKRDKQRRWTTLGVKPPSPELYCGYVVISGPAGSLMAAGPRGRKLLGGSAPNEPWYYIRAKCSYGGGKHLLFETTSLSQRIFEDRN